MVAEPSPSLMLPISLKARLRAKARMERMAKARGRARRARVRPPQKQWRRTRVLWWSPLARNRLSRIRMTSDLPPLVFYIDILLQLFYGAGACSIQLAGL